MSRSFAISAIGVLATQRLLEQRLWAASSQPQASMIAFGSSGLTPFITSLQGFISVQPHTLHLSTSGTVQFTFSRRSGAKCFLVQSLQT